MWIWTLAALLLLPPAVDFATWSLWRQKLQHDADLSAQAGALALRRGEPAVAAARARLARFRPALAEPPAIEHPPAGGPYEGRAEAIRVRLTAVRAPFFWSKLFGPARMTAVGTVALIPDRPAGTRPVRVE